MLVMITAQPWKGLRISALRAVSADGSLRVRILMRRPTFASISGVLVARPLEVEPDLRAPDGVRLIADRKVVPGRRAPNLASGGEKVLNWGQELHNQSC